MNDVSRETAALREHWAGMPGLAQFATILGTRGVERGLVGPREIPRIWPRHIANCAVVAEEARVQIPVGSRVADVGSGAGLPGLVWALVRPDLDVTLIEPLLRRATFLAEVVEELGVADRVHVERARAEEVRARYDVVTARAVARLPQLAGWTLPLTQVGGWVIALKGAGAAAEVAEAAAAITTLGGGTAEIATFGATLLTEPTTTVLIPKVGQGTERRR